MLVPTKTLKREEPDMHVSNTHDIFLQYLSCVLIRHVPFLFACTDSHAAEQDKLHLLYAIKCRPSTPVEHKSSQVAYSVVKSPLKRNEGGEYFWVEWSFHTDEGYFRSGWSPLDCPLR